jgi:hypothetical protein
MEVKKVTHETVPLLNMDKIEKGKANDNPFKKILEGIGSQYPDALRSISTSPRAEEILPGPLPPAAPLNFLSDLKDPAQIRLKGIQSTEKTLDMLEQYQKAMANPNLSLKNIYPLIQSLSQELQGLNVLSEKLSPSDPLRPILTNTGIVSAVEIEKFHRGEYI